MFKNAKVGDKVVDFRLGEGKISNVESCVSDYPIQAVFSVDSAEGYTFDGKLYADDIHPSLFPAGTEIVRPEVKKRVDPVNMDIKSLMLLILDEVKGSPEISGVEYDKESVLSSGMVAILEKLEEMRRGLVDIENAIEAK